MKPIIACTTVGVALAFLCAAGHARAEIAPMAYTNRPFPPGFYNKAIMDQRTQVQTRLKKLRKEAISLQRADGGTLSDAHRADLEGRLAILHKEACAAAPGGC